MRAAFEHGPEDGGRQHAEPGGLRARRALGAVACRHMADLVADHAGEVGLAVHVGHQPARHVDVAAGQGEGVDLRAVDDGEVPVELRPVRVARQALADLVDVGLQPGVLDLAVLRQHLLVLLAAGRDLAALVHHRALDLARHRIFDGRARRQGGAEQHGNEQQAHRMPP